jgi:hypothetical protein
MRAFEEISEDGEVVPEGLISAQNAQELYNKMKTFAPKTSNSTLSIKQELQEIYKHSRHSPEIGMDRQQAIALLAYFVFFDAVNETANHKKSCSANGRDLPVWPGRRGQRPTGFLLVSGGCPSVCWAAGVLGNGLGL